MCVSWWWIFCLWLALLEVQNSEEFGTRPANEDMVQTRGSRQVFSCISDGQCGAGRYCHASSPTPGSAPSRCWPCRRRGRRCRRDQMCCRGNYCHQNVCTKHAGGKKAGSVFSRPHRGGRGSGCVRSSDCVIGQCCARYLWTRRCRAEPLLGHACSPPHHHHNNNNKGTRTPDLFQRCPCSPGLTCTPHTHTPAHTPYTHTHQQKHLAKLNTCQRT